MINIPISEKQKEEIEIIYWNWISKYHLKGLINVINSDAILRELILNGKKDLKKAIKKYLFSNYNELAEIKIKIDNLNAEKRYIRNSTKAYIMDRYENYRNSQAAKIVHVLDITICPYCNQNHINIVYGKDGKARLWGDLDHFYDKSTYPQLAICLYNLIPVCKVCNQLKSSRKGVIVNPYNLEKKTNIKFGTEFDDKFDLDYLQGKSQNFNIMIDKSKLTAEDREEIRIFDLENRHKQLKRNAQEIIVKSRAYDGLYEEMLKTQFQLTEDEIRAHIFGFTENHLNRILSKFNMDIMNEFRN